jgi:hypothetical protein
MSTQDCIGATDGTHVTIIVSREQVASFKGRKNYASENVLADVVIDFDLKFTYVLLDGKD